MTTSPKPDQPDALGGTRMQPPPETLEVPLRFARHSFEAHCYNTLRCSVIYTQEDFTRLLRDEPRGPPKTADYQKSWGFASYIGIPNFPPPAELRWTSIDGQAHEVTLDISMIFKDELIWHKVPKADMAHFFEGPVASDPSIHLEINNRTVNVYIQDLIPTKTEQIPGNKHSTARTDMFLVWTRTY